MKGKKSVSLFEHDITLYLKAPNDFTRKLSGMIKNFEQNGNKQNEHIKINNHSICQNDLSEKGIRKNQVFTRVKTILREKP